MLREIESRLAIHPLPQAEGPWEGADVVILPSSKAALEPQSFYAEPRSVVTPYALELSWLFETLRDAFYAENLLDSQTKIEFFGRLANAANRCLGRGTDSSVRLCAAVLHEAFAIYDEIGEGTFESLPVAVGNEIVDDYVDDARQTGFIGIEDTRKFFAERGVDI